MLRQYELMNENDRSTVVAWLEHDSRVKRGSRLTLKENPGSIYRVMIVYNHFVESKDIKRGWNNNI